MDYFNIYLENLPSVTYFLVCCIPTLSYFASVKLYSLYHEETKKPNIDSINYCNKLISKIVPVNTFIVFPLFNSNNELERLNLYYIITGVLLVDTLEYMIHYFYHYKPNIYLKLHKEHHSSSIMSPKHAFLNNDIAATKDSVLIFLSMFLLKFSFFEYVSVTSLSIISTVCDHTNTQPEKFHYIHHHVNKNKNFQQPFFTFWDHIFGTYYPNSKLKIPFVP